MKNNWLTTNEYKVANIVQHKDIIEPEDWKKISTHLNRGSSSPIILRQLVWYYLSFYFVSRGLEFYRHLKVDSFQFIKDLAGREYELPGGIDGHDGCMTQAVIAVQ